MTQFRKKPVVVDAIQWNGLALSVPIPDWFTEPWMNRIINRHIDDSSKLTINTLEGVMTVSPGDWIIKGTHGEIYPCKPDIFESAYERVDDDNQLDH